MEMAVRYTPKNRADMSFDQIRKMFNKRIKENNS